MTRRGGERQQAVRVGIDPDSKGGAGKAATITVTVEGDLGEN